MKPAVCNKVYEKRKHTIITPNHRGFFWYIRVILFVLGTGLVFLVVFYVIYKLKLRKEYKEKASEEVENALSKYYHNNRGYSGVDEED
jgi:uncharacterized membrane protein YgaE (UPF0421/DUF939 family)